LSSLKQPYIVVTKHMTTKYSIMRYGFRNTIRQSTTVDKFYSWPFHDVSWI